MALAMLRDESFLGKTEKELRTLLDGPAGRGRKLGGNMIHYPVRWESESEIQSIIFQFDPNGRVTEIFTSGWH